MEKSSISGIIALGVTYIQLIIYIITSYYIG